MKKIFLSLITISFLFSSKAQITKGNWLVGGNISFSRTKLNNDLGGYTETNLNTMGNVGYFLVDKLVGGIRPNLFLSKTRYNTSTGSTRSEIGPFLRYYILSEEQAVNLFLDGSYTHGWSNVKNNNRTTNKTSSNSFLIMGGPTVFLNSAVAIELSIGYSLIRFNDDIHSKKSIITSSVGLQFYLEKE